MVHRIVWRWGFLISLTAAAACQNQDVESNRSSRSGQEKGSADKSSKGPEATADKGTADDTAVSQEQEKIAAFALSAADAPVQPEFSSLRLSQVEADAEPTDEQLLQLVELAKKRFPELANVEIQNVQAILKPASSDSMALAEGSKWSVQPRQSGTGPLGGKWQGSQATSTSGTKVTTASGKGAFGNFAGGGVASNPNVGTGGYAFGWIPGVGVGFAYGGVSVSGQGGGGYCAISVWGSGCDTF